MGKPSPMATGWPSSITLGFMAREADVRVSRSERAGARCTTCSPAPRSRRAGKLRSSENQCPSMARARGGRGLLCVARCQWLPGQGAPKGRSASPVVFWPPTEAHRRGSDPSLLPRRPPPARRCIAALPASLIPYLTPNTRSCSRSWAQQ